MFRLDYSYYYDDCFLTRDSRHIGLLIRIACFNFFLFCVSARVLAMSTRRVTYQFDSLCIVHVWVVVIRAMNGSVFPSRSSEGAHSPKRFSQPHTHSTHVHMFSCSGNKIPICILHRSTSIFSQLCSFLINFISIRFFLLPNREIKYKKTHTQKIEYSSPLLFRTKFHVFCCMKICV